LNSDRGIILHGLNNTKWLAKRLDLLVEE